MNGCEQRDESLIDLLEVEIIGAVTDVFAKIGLSDDFGINQNAAYNAVGNERPAITRMVEAGLDSVLSDLRESYAGRHRAA